MRAGAAAPRNWLPYTVKREGGVQLRDDFDPENPLHIYWPPDVHPPEVYSTTTGRLIQFKKIQIIVSTTVSEIAKALIKPRVWYQRGEHGADKAEDEYDVYLYHDSNNKRDTKILSWGSMVHMIGRVVYLPPEKDDRTRFLKDCFHFYDNSSVIPINLTVFFDHFAKEGDLRDRTNENRDLLLRASAMEDRFVEIYAYPAIVIDRREGKRYTRLNLMKARESTQEAFEGFPFFCEMVNKGYLYNS